MDVDESTGFEPRFKVLDALDRVTLREAGGSLTVGVELVRMSWPRRAWQPETNLAFGAAPDFTGEPARTVIERGDLR
ncbi:hypothetical protein ACIOD2_15270 [Amycolatopsis sp. NPDC088138]|uniref:hypothetical protein n=1 Tax=Amycolatopsis sp. NPDC088138 TaxID=3363938 RepID=UPI003817807E